MSAFFALGMAYIWVEIGYIQRFTLYLGRPVVVFAVVLGTLLLFSGIGSGLSRRMGLGQKPVVASLLAALVALGCGVVALPLCRLTLAWSVEARVAVAVALVAPAGFFMGVPFPSLVTRLERTLPERIPWAWAINAFATVVGSIGAVVGGMAWGFSSVMFFGVVFYLLTALASWLMPAS